MQWRPHDVIGLVVIVGLVMLIAMGHDSIMADAFLGVVVVYHGTDIVIRSKK
jgi:hypothetical protein